MSRFTHSAAGADAELEARIRATLRRHADDIEPHQPPWSELVAQAGAVVLPLHGTELAPAHLKSTGRRPHLAGPWVRPTLAAAVALAIAMSAAVVLQGRGGEDPTGAADSETVLNRKVPDSPVIVAPGATEFDRGTAVPLPFPEVLTGRERELENDPTQLALAYLDQWGLPSQPGFEVDAASKPETIVSNGFPMEINNLWWSVYDGDVLLTTGTVFLRPELDSGIWRVVGAYTRHSYIGISGLRRAEGKVSFVVNDYLPDPDVQVGIDGRVLDRVQLDLPTRTFVLEDPAPGQVITIEVQHMLNDEPASITTMALAPSGEAIDAGAMPIPSTVTIPPTFTKQ